MDVATAETVAAILQALAAPSRLLILSTLRQGARPVTELAVAIGMEQSAVSHQLRLLRALGLVTRRRDGRRVVYGLHDDHVARLLNEAVYHIEHLKIEHSKTSPAGKGLIGTWADSRRQPSHG
ncbi:ArsR/SmtB family transcription factor [Streptantibioticus rubrisoli]|uniref:Metalloregulator ArsR/SmtB family transcription factor n=1 Tax=Streptantibioticus rubrisoli TaxID=1387313 RepID=A0ABT1P9H0_9ACTN|nr:metalloregulator ArsR/SmtB family transcription factor [Streptantibioticus rubrisoli]MCQ4042006.1 metalloregulator ArsR/SmtB family transcription factor [Streptantibioticus rubrisoli]